MARELASAAASVLVVEKRPTSAATCTTRPTRPASSQHRYGRTSSTPTTSAPSIRAPLHRQVLRKHEVLADWYGTYPPKPFNKNSWRSPASRRPRAHEKLVDTFGDERKVTITELRRDDPELSEVADFVYKNVFLTTRRSRGLTPYEADLRHGARARVRVARQPLLPDASPGHAADWL
ncbi:MAG: hypothetical protein ACLT98_11270 [Eggerthellaceae bacterium]